MLGWPSMSLGPKLRQLHLQAWLLGPIFLRQILAGWGVLHCYALEALFNKKDRIKMMAAMKVLKPIANSSSFASLYQQSYW